MAGGARFKRKQAEAKKKIIKRRENGHADNFDDIRNFCPRVFCGADNFVLF